MWLSIYNRVAETRTGLDFQGRQNGFGNKRGKEKRRRLLAYLQEHPEGTPAGGAQTNPPKVQPLAKFFFKPKIFRPGIGA